MATTAVNGSVQGAGESSSQWQDKLLGLRARFHGAITSTDCH